MSENISTFVSKLKSNPDILGIILFGSWARGNQRPDSDVDLLVIQKKGFKRTVEYHCNLAFEITYTTKRGAIDFWRANRDDCAELWNVGQVLYDKCGVVEELRKVGDQIIAQGKQPFPQTQLEHLRFDAEDQLRAIRELYREDSATAQLILGHKLFALTELFFDIRQL